MFLSFCFDVGFVFGMSSLVIVLFLFCFLFCIHRLSKNIVFSAVLVYFSHVTYKVVLYFFLFQVLVLVFFFLVLFVSILDIRFVLFCDCVVNFPKNRTKWFCCLHFVVCFPFCCFVLIFVFFCFFIPLRKDPPKTRHSKKPKKQKCRKRTNKKIS